ncbi:hypothetical protein AAHC03_01450 [Spirometra sp. Aus1]
MVTLLQIVILALSILEDRCLELALERAHSDVIGVSGLVLWYKRPRTGSRLVGGNYTYTHQLLHTCFRGIHSASSARLHEREIQRRHTGADRSFTLASYPRVYIDSVDQGVVGSRWGGGNGSYYTSFASRGRNNEPEILSPALATTAPFSTSKFALDGDVYFPSKLSQSNSPTSDFHKVIGGRNNRMPVFCGIGSIVLASRTPIYYACSVDLTWQSTVHSCQRCPRAALTASAATAAIATQANVEGAISRFCPAGVHMGKCEPASGLFSGSWGPVSNASSALGSGLASKLTKGNAETSSAVADSARQGEAAPAESETVIKPTWVPPNLPLPTPVYSRASFSPSLPVRSVSPPSVPLVGKLDRIRHPVGLAHTDEGDKDLSSSETISEKPADGKESASSKADQSAPGTAESSAPCVSSPKQGLQNQLLEKKDVSEELKTDKLTNNEIQESEKLEKNTAATERPKLSDLEVVTKTPPWESPTDAVTTTTKPAALLDAKGAATETGIGTLTDKENRPHVTVPSIAQNLPEVSAETKLPDRPADGSSPPLEKTHQDTEDVKSPSAKVKPTPLESHTNENVKPVVKPHLPVDGTTDNIAPVARDKVPPRLTDNSSVIPPFFLSPGHSGMTPADCNAELERIRKAITADLEEAAKSSDEGELKSSSKTALPFSLFNLVTKACGCPLYWKRALFLASGGQNDETPVAIDAILKTWRSVLETCSDEATRFVHLLTRGKSHYLVPNDFRPIIQDVVDTHPSLGFLQAARDFHSRYVTTVVARIFFCVNSSWSGRISLGELRRSNFLKVLASLEVEEDINHVTQYFSYEHFYVIYCKFWEIDTDHDLIITKADLLRHNNYAISERMIDRIFSGAVTRGSSFKEGTMTYSEFVWFLLAEEDKRHPRSIEYWFRCMDLDGDGVLSLYELEYFYSEQSARMEEMGIEPPTLEDCLCQCLDMVKPSLTDRIRLSDLKHCSLCTIFFDTFFNLPKYLQHEQRDPFANIRDNEDGTAEMSDWDRYASDAYEMLVASENGNQESAGGIGDEDEEDDEDEPSEDDPLGSGSGARASAVTSDQPAVEAEATADSPTKPTIRLNNRILSLHLVASNVLQVLVF